MSTFTHALATDNYGPAKFIVSANAYEGTHTTISAALAVASSGDVIAIRPGTYTESLAIPSGITLIAFGVQSGGQSVSIAPVIVNTQLTFAAGGGSNFYGIQFVSNGADLISISGSTALTADFTNCQFKNQASNTYAIVTCSNANAVISIAECAIISNSSTAQIFNMSNGTIYLANSTQFGSAATSTFSGGSQFSLTYSAFPSAFTTSGSASFLAYYSTFFGNSNTTITLGGSGTHQAYFCIFSAGSASALTVNTTLTSSYNSIYSTNTDAITGSGHIIYDVITYLSTSSTNNVTTQTQQPIQLATSAANQLLYSTTGNVVGGLAAVNNGTLISSSSGVPEWLADGTTGQVLTATTGSPPSWANPFQIQAFSFTYDVSTASGTQNFTGLSFKPVAVMSLAVSINADSALTQTYSTNGVDDGTNHACLNISAGDLNPVTTYSIVVGTSGTAYQLGYISAFLSDGFTITWAKTNSPTGLATLTGMAIGYH